LIIALLYKWNDEEKLKNALISLENKILKEYLRKEEHSGYNWNQFKEWLIDNYKDESINTKFRAEFEKK
jgi:hypothetical protein